GVTTLDASGNGNVGTITGSAWTTNGKIGDALSFSTISDRLSINSSASLNNASAISTSAWIKSNNVSQEQTIISRNGPFFLRISANRLRIGIHTDGVWTFINGGILLTSGTWNYVVLTYDGSLMKSYINGILDTSTTKTGNFSSFSNLYFGYPVPNGENYTFNGIIDDVRIYSRSLSLSEIQSIYNAGK
ncbi:MAG: LamG domain-containing protein, partial [Candidatus Colwellbacteria bacterium]|nr:LamG domain-containing protein [Candidatus Colwellbacteria bacterium]